MTTIAEITPQKTSSRPTVETIVNTDDLSVHHVEWPDDDLKRVVWVSAGPPAQSEVDEAVGVLKDWVDGNPDAPDISAIAASVLRRDAVLWVMRDLEANILSIGLSILTGESRLHVPFVFGSPPEVPLFAECVMGISDHLGFTGSVGIVFRPTADFPPVASKLDEAGFKMTAVEYNMDLFDWSEDESDDSE